MRDAYWARCLAIPICNCAGAAHDGFLESRDWQLPLSRIRIPVLLWHGDQDTTVPVAAAVAIKDQVPIPVSAPWRSAQQLVSFLCFISASLGPAVAVRR